VLYVAHSPDDTQIYRALRFPWFGQPDDAAGAGGRGDRLGTARALRELERRHRPRRLARARRRLGEHARAVLHGPLDRLRDAPQGSARAAFVAVEALERKRSGALDVSPGGDAADRRSPRVRGLSRMRRWRTTPGCQPP
jgi:hypothetical protein